MRAFADPALDDPAGHELQLAAPAALYVPAPHATLPPALPTVPPPAQA